MIIEKDIINTRGLLPIRAIQNDFLHFFDGIRPDFVRWLQTNFSDYRISPEIIYSDGGTNIPLPHICDSDLRNIHLHENYCSRLWLVSYGLMEYFIEKIHIPAINGKYDGVNNHAITHALELIEFSVKNSPNQFWDRNYFPNPEKYDDSNTLVGITNFTYNYSLSFIILHEIQHAIRDHFRTNYETGENISLEVEADKKAFGLLFSGFMEDEKRMHKAVGIIASFALSMFCKFNLSDSRTHPSPDRRILQFMNYYSGDDPNSEVWALCCHLYVIWDELYSVGLSPDYGLTYKDQFLSFFVQ